MRSSILAHIMHDLVVGLRGQYFFFTELFLGIIPRGHPVFLILSLEGKTPSLPPYHRLLISFFSAANMAASLEETNVTYGELAEIEAEFDVVETEISESFSFYVFVHLPCM